MIVKEQKPIQFINKCGAIYNEEYLKKATLWYSKKPVTRLKTVFLYGKYPAISVYGKKLHIHRLIAAFAYLPKYVGKRYVHHLNENKLDARLSNLKLLKPSIHQSHHNKGKQVSLETRKRLTEANKRNWATKWKNRRIYENPELLNR
jgi:hypothetical protein